MNKKAIKALIISLIMAAQTVLPVFADEIENKEILEEETNITQTTDTDDIDGKNEANDQENNESVDIEENKEIFEILDYEEENPTPSEFGDIQKKNTITVDVYIGSVGNFKLSKATFALYDKDLGYITQKDILIENTKVYHTITFDVPEYSVGEIFYLSCIDGLDCVKYQELYYGINHTIRLETFSDAIEKETDKIVYGNQFSVTAYPLQDKDTGLFVNGNKKELMFPIKLDGSTAIISFPDIVKLLGLSDEQYIYNSETGEIDIAFDGKGVILFVGRNEGYIKDNNIIITAPRVVDGIIYLPLRFVAEALGATVNAQVSEESMKVDMSLFSIKYTEQNKFINKQGITSKTNYLIWVSKPRFTVTVFTKTNEGWKAIKDMPCSIGAPSTPTVVGQFEYFSKEKQWSYPGYYVAPIMRFYRGYAFHSTLIRYNGTPYDGRVGKQISHGCIRMRPEDINWMADTIPLYTKVYITD